jgi:hypothetical protein
MFPLFLEEELGRGLAVGAAGGDQTGHRLLGREEVGQGECSLGPAGAVALMAARHCPDARAWLADGNGW